MSTPSIHYEMRKMGWNAGSGAYDNVECVIAPLTIKQVRARVARLPESTNWLWRILAIMTESGPTSYTVGSISADEFSRDVPLY